MDGHVASILVKTLFEVWALWSVGDDVFGQIFSELGLELNQPVLAFSGFHCGIILPIDIHTIQVIVQDKCRKCLSSGDGVFSSCSWELSCSESTDHDLDACIIVLSLEVLLDLGLCLPELRVWTEVFDWVRPDEDTIGCSCAHPEGKSQVVVDCFFGEPRHTDTSSNRFRRPPRRNRVHVGQPDWVINRSSLTLHGKQDKKNEDTGLKHINIKFCSLKKPIFTVLLKCESFKALHLQKFKNLFFFSSKIFKLLVGRNITSF